VICMELSLEGLSRQHAAAVAWVGRSSSVDVWLCQELCQNTHQQQQLLQPRQQLFQCLPVTELLNTVEVPSSLPPTPQPLPRVDVTSPPPPPLPPQHTQLWQQLRQNTHQQQQLLQASRSASKACLSLNSWMLLK
jgi:hypothetical protein